MRFRPIILATAAVLVATSCRTHEYERPEGPPHGHRRIAKELPPLDPPKLRLPATVHPTHAKVELTIDPEAATATGSVEIAIHVDRPTSTIWLNAADLSITSAKVGAFTVRADQHGEYLALVLDRGHIGIGDTTLAVAFTAKIDHARSRGLYAEKEGDRTYAYTFFEAIDARRAFPCFDEPSAKIPWQLTFHVKQDDVALGNAPVVRETPEPNGMKKVELAESKPLPSYLVAFVVGPFDVVDDGVAGRVHTPVRFIVPKGRADELAWSKDVTPRVVAALENYFDMDYPFGKLDVAVVPRYWGTMEHPGIVAMGQPLALIRPDQATRSRKEHYANILAHELSHYWFGDVVTMAWWDDTWLNEALGEWMDMRITDDTEPGWHVRDARPEFSVGAMIADETLAARAMRQPVDTTEGIQASFDNDLVYLKGASVFRMFEAYVGPEKWQAFIRGYIHAHEWGNASASDFLAAAGAALGAPIEAALRSFVEQPGVPRVSGTVTCAADKRTATLALTQTRALHEGDRDPNDRTWRVPVCVRYGASAKDARATCTLLATKTATVPLETCPTWLVPNADANGYYRAAFDPALTAKAPNTTTAERQMRLADVAGAMERGELGIDRVLAEVPGALADPSEKVAKAGLELATIEHRGLDDALAKKARAYQLATVGPVARKLGWARGAKDTDERQELRRAALQRAGALDPALAATAKKLAATWLKSHTGIEDDLVGAMLGAVAYNGDVADFDRMLDAARDAPDRTMQTRLLAVLGLFRKPETTARALALFDDKELDIRDSLPAMFGLVQQRETRDATLAWLETNLGALRKRMRDDDAAQLVGFLAGAYCDADRVARIEKLVVPIATTIDGAANAVTRGLEQSRQCTATTAKQLPALQKILAKY